MKKHSIAKGRKTGQERQSTQNQAQSVGTSSSPGGVRTNISGLSKTEDDKERASLNVSSNIATIGGTVTAATSTAPPTLADDTEDEFSIIEGGEENEGNSFTPDSKTDFLIPVDSGQFLSKKAQFRKYLTKSGFKYAIIRAFVALYEEEHKNKPDDPLAWIMGFVGHGIPTNQELEAHRTEVKEIREKIDKLQQDNLELRTKIEEREHAAAPDSLADQELKKMMENLTELGLFAPLPSAAGGGVGDEQIILT